MKKDTGTSAESTQSKGYGKGSTKGITPDAKPGQNTAKTKGNVAKFAAGKKTVGK